MVAGIQIQRHIHRIGLAELCGYTVDESAPSLGIGDGQHKELRLIQGYFSGYGIRAKFHLGQHILFSCRNLSGVW